MTQENEKPGKLPYVAPSLRPIELMTDEVLSSNCKVEGVCEDMSAPTNTFGS